MNSLLAQAAVIARRDFMAIVGTPTFLIFLLAPFLMLGISAAMGVGAASMATQSLGQAQIAVIAQGPDAERIVAADARRRSLYRQGETRQPRLSVIAPQANLDAQSRAVLAGEQGAEVVMFGPLDRPHIVHEPGEQQLARYLADLAEEALRAERAGMSGAALSRPVIVATQSAAPDRGDRNATGVGAVFIIFLLTLVLAGQTVGSLTEEKANKVIEILAASVRLEAVFLGKLFGMLGVSVLFIAFWALFAAAGALLLPAGSLSNLQPAVGLLPFALLCGAYFTTAFLLLGAIFLGIGAQASTVREIQMLSLPITIFQVAMFALTSAAASDPSSSLTRFAQIFPFSSPFAMTARAASEPALWPHLLALAWQLFWVALTIAVAARAFRLGVLKAGGGWRALVGLAPKPAPLTSL